MRIIAIFILSVVLASVAKSQQAKDKIVYNIVGFNKAEYTEILLKYPYDKTQVIFYPSKQEAKAYGFCNNVDVNSKGILGWTEAFCGQKRDLETLGMEVANILVEHLKNSNPIENLRIIRSNSGVEIFLEKVENTI